MISIILTAYKEEKTIIRAIEAILKNEISVPYEILVLAPDEKTLKVAEKYAEKNKHIRVVKDDGEGKPSALNIAFTIAKGDILILTDGDVYVGKKSLPALLEPFKNQNIGATSGRPVSTDSTKTMFGFWSHLLTSIADERRKNALKNKKRIFCSGYLYAFRKGLIKKIPKETLSEDGLISHFVYSQGYKIDYVPEAEVYVKYPSNFRDWINQKKRSAGGYNQIRQWTKTEMRSFSKESSGAFHFFKYLKTPKQLFWLLALFLSRVYLWILIFKDINIKNKSFKKIWVRVESTK